jgi:putative flippase GtrA
MEENKEIQTCNKEIVSAIQIPVAKYKWYQEGIIAAIIILLLTAGIYFIVKLLPINVTEESLVYLTYSQDKYIQFDANFGLWSLILGALVSILYYVLFFFIRPSGIKPDFGPRYKWLIAYIILALFGYLAYLVIAILLSGWSISLATSSGVATLLVGIYDYLIYKSYMEGRTMSNALFWEIFRFAIVGLVAAIFDFATCFIFQFIIFNGSTAFYVTGIATGMGFVIGVTINYLMSTYMVYKAAKSNFSKSAKGIITFLVLSILGLLIGVGIQYVLYDFLFINIGVSFLTYPVDFVIRTLVVMVYNYITRKLFIYR